MDLALVLVTEDILIMAMAILIMALAILMIHIMAMEDIMVAVTLITGQVITRLMPTLLHTGEEKDQAVYHLPITII